MENVSDITEIEAGAPETGAAIAVSRSRFADFVELAKPRLNFLVLITTAVGFYMAARSGTHWVVLVHALIGTALTAGGASALNQLIERDHDARMPRTRKRPLPAGRVMALEALAFGSILGIVGVAYLLVMVNALTAALGAFTLLSYIFVYTPLKRLTTLNTIVGAVPGAIPPVMGCTAAGGVLTPEAVALFGILFFWQMPHFLAIAILYRDDYARGGFKMLPVVDPTLETTGRQILVYGMALIPVSLLPSVLHATGAIYFTAAMLLGLAFLSFGVSCAATRSRTDARKLFFASIIYLPLLLAFMMIDKT
ncbi:MAG: heme o synthase [Tepidisphaeraceae bacterium]